MKHMMEITMTTDARELYSRAVEHWGQRTALVFAVEELAEVNQLLARLANHHQINKATLLDEIADAVIMLTLVKQMFLDKEGSLVDAIEHKLQSLSHDLDSESDSA